MQALKNRPFVMTIIGLLIGAMALIGYCLVYPRYSQWEFKQSLLQQPIYRTIQARYPEQFEGFLQELEKTKQMPDYQERSFKAANQLVNYLFFKHILVADNALIMVNLKATLDLYRYLNTQAPALILQLEGIAPYTAELEKIKKQKQFQGLMSHLMETKRLIIEVPLKDKTLSTMEGEKDFNDILDILRQTHQTAVDVIFKGKQQDTPPSQTTITKIMLDFYQELVNAGEEKAGKVVRYIAFMVQPHIERGG